MLSHMPRLDAEVKMFLTYVFRRLCLQPVTGSDNIVLVFFFFFNLLATLHGMCDISSLTDIGDRWAPG